MKKTASLLLAAAAGMAFMTPALAADLIIEEEVVDVGVVDVSGDWEGIYIAGFVGGAVGTADHVNGGGGPCGDDDEGCDVDMSGWLVGAEIGANFYLTDSVVAGVAADIAWADIYGSDDFPVIGFSENYINWQGSVRGVLGFDAGGFMPYVTAGLAAANASHFSDFAGTTASATHIGATAGVGVAVAVSDNMAIDLQYRHSWYGEEEYDVGAAPFNPVFDLSTDQVTLGLRFSM